MKKELIIAAITFLFAATPVFAYSESNHENNNKNFFDKHADNDGDKDDSITPTTLPTPASLAICNPSLNWKNHGSYVSCIAHLDHNDRDDIARSEIGKHHFNYPTTTPAPTISPTISVTPIPSETITPTPSVSVTPTESISPTPNTSPTPNVSPTQSTSVSPTPDNTDGDVPQPSFTTIDNAIVRIISFFSHLL